MRVFTALLAAAMATGCAQIFGIDETDPYEIRLTAVRKHAASTVIAEPVDLSLQTSTFVIPDDTDPSGLRSIPGNLIGTDTFQAELPGPGGGILFTIPDDTIKRLWVFPARDQRMLIGHLGRPGAELALPASALDLTINLDVAYSSEGLWFYAIGPWAARSYPPPELPVAPAMTWDPPATPWMPSFWSQISGRPLERIRASDSLWVLRYVGSVLAGAVQIPGFDQMDAAETISGTLVTVPADRTLTAQFATTTPGPRYAATTPAVGLPPAMSWTLVASPTTEIGSAAGPQLHQAVLTEAETGAVTAMYGNPFPWPDLVGFSTSAARGYTPPAPLTAVGLYAAMYSYATPSAGITFALPQGLPLLVSVDGRALTADGTVVTIDRARAVELTFTLDRAEACDIYGLRLDEFFDDAGVTRRVTRLAMSGLEPRWLIPNAELVTGATYVLQAQCTLGGVPNLATGDLVTRSWPLDASYFDGAVFTIAEVAP